LMAAVVVVLWLIAFYGYRRYFTPLFVQQASY
jgi:hypothetical protein